MLHPQELRRLMEHRAWAWWDFWWEENGPGPAALPPFFNGMARRAGILPLTRRLCDWFRKPEGED